jgi:hypothetical protein
MEIVDNKRNKQVLPYYTLILSGRFGERKTNDLFFNDIKEEVTVYKIGDCLQVKGIFDAILSANMVSRKI